MLDVFDLPNALGVQPNASNNVKLFWPNQPTGSTLGWQIWNKPRNASLLSIIAISGGAGGGGARGNTTGLAKGGGGGGGSSGVSRYTYPMYFVPDTLNILVGAGGPGGAGGSTADGTIGTAGQLSYVSIYPATTGNNLFAVSGAAAPLPGVGGTVTTAAGGAAGTIATLAGAPWSNFALCATFLAGVVGSAAGSGAGNNAGTTVTPGTAGQITPGCGGGASLAGTAAGGGYAAIANTPFFAWAGGATSGGAGQPGFRHMPYPMIYGGCGGGSIDVGTGGEGGACGYNAPGAGGGGGGGGNPGGRGGYGGPGLVLMISHN
jgi:hypothetical protein